MKLRRAYEGIDRSEKNRKLMMKTGRTPFGQRLWTPQHDKKVVDFYPDIKRIKIHLNFRTEAAIRARARFLGVTRRQHRWKMHDVSRLRKMYISAHWQDILEAFPDFTPSQIRGCIRTHEMKRDRKRYKTTKYECINDIRDQLIKLNMTMKDLDLIARTGDYFSKSQWHGKPHAKDEAIGRAVRALGGRLTIIWDD